MLVWVGARVAVPGTGLMPEARWVWGSGQQMTLPYRWNNHYWMTRGDCLKVWRWGNTPLYASPCHEISPYACEYSYHIPQVSSHHTHLTRG